MLAFSQVSDPSYHMGKANSVSDETYQFIGGELPGCWAGTGANIDGLYGEIEERDFLALMEGKHPITEQYLIQQNGKKHRPALDLVLSPDKTVSVAWARADSKLRLHIEQAHHQSVIETLKFIELHAGYTRRGKDGVKHQKVVGLMAAVFQHSTSRAGDPQLHSHLVIMNCAKRFDGSYGSIESRYILKWQKAASLIYQAKLAESLRDLGFDTKSSERSFSIHGIPQSVCNQFSKRRKQILGSLQAKGIFTARAAALAAKMTRGQKQAIDRPELFKSWQREMDEMNFTEAQFKEVGQQSIGVHLPNENDLTAVNFNHQYLSEILTESASVFSEADIYNTALKLGLKLSVPATMALQLAESFIDSEISIELQTEHVYERHFTTLEMRNLEHELVRKAQALHHIPFIFGLSVEDILNAQALTGLTLSEEQQEAVLGVLGNSSLEIMSGSAGSGKSTAMKIVNNVYTSKNITVWGAAIAKDAAKNLETETGIKSYTIAKLLIDLDNRRSKVKHGDVVVIDEAGQIGLKTMLKLQEHAMSKGFKVILTGEDKQLDAIEHGGVLQHLSRPDVVGTTRIETIRRQRKEWDRIAVANFRDGNAVEALKKYEKHGRLHFSRDINSAYKELVEDWHLFRSQNPNKGTMVLARTWNDVLELNRLIRSKLQQEGKVGSQDVKIRGAVGSKDIDFLLSSNDRVRFTRNDASLDFTNGDTGNVLRITSENDSKLKITIKKDNGKIVTVMQDQYCNDKGHLYLAPAYAQTIYSGQGKTIDGDVFVLHDPMIDRAHAYVAMSRHKDDCHLYTAIDQVIDEVDEAGSKTNVEGLVLQRLSRQFSSERRAKLSIEYEPVRSDKAYKLESQERDLEELTI